VIQGFERNVGVLRQAVVGAAQKQDLHRSFLRRQLYLKVGVRSKTHLLVSKRP
jgi:hypothetical protein